MNKNVWTLLLSCYHSGCPILTAAVLVTAIAVATRLIMETPSPAKEQSTMSLYRNAIRFIISTLALTLPLSAYAVNYDVKVLMDTDTNRATGCTVSTASGPVSGIEQVLTTSISVSGGSATVTGVTRQLCTGGFLGAPIPVDGGWNVGVSPTGNLFVETHLGANIITMTNIGTMRLDFAVSSGSISDAITSDFGNDILYPVRPGRHHAVMSPNVLRSIHLDGLENDWNGVPVLAYGDAVPPVLRFLDAAAYVDSNDLFFDFHIQTNVNAPTANDDTYSLGTLGGTLTVSTLGVLTNDTDPNNLGLSAILVDGPEHGTVTLNANGGFTYVNNGSDVQQDQFHYRITNGTLQSNVATVTISLPGSTNDSGKYVFTSADHVTFAAGQPNTFTVTVTGKPTPALSEDGALPPGVTFVDNGDGTGKLSGTPAGTSGGIYNIVFHAEKNKPHQLDQNFTLTVAQAPGITSASSTTFTVGSAGTFQVTAIGFPAPSFGESGALPSGVTFNSGTGVLSGTPAPGSGGIYHITFTATNSAGTDVQAFTLTVDQAPAITSANNAHLQAGSPANFTVTTTGFPTAAVARTSGALPTGVTFTDNGNGTATIGGTPAPGSGGTYPIVITASNGVAPNATQNFTIVVCNSLVVNNPAISTGTANAAFSQTFTQVGGVGAVVFSLNSGTLPTGLTLSSAGVLSGTPTQTGAFPITVKVTDSNGCIGIGATYNLTINCQTITVTNPTTNTGTVNAAFSQTFTASNTIGAVTFSTASTLPAGLTLSSGGVLSGTPTQTGSFPIVVKATDANGCFGNGATYTLTIGCQTITVTNPGTATGTVNIAFSQTFTASNTIGTVTFTTASTLPTGLTLSSGGVLSGTPTQTGSFPIVVKATDANGCFGNGATYTLVIGCQTITVNNPATASGTVNVAFSQTFTAGNAIGATTFTTASTLPTGLTLSTGGVLSGTPTQTGSFPIVVHVVDANGCSGNGATYTLTIACQVITVTNPVTNSGTVNVAFSQTFTAGNAIGATTFTTASTLPTGLTLATNGTLSGTPTQTGTFNIVVTATDANGCTGTGATYSLTIGCQTITVTNPGVNTGTVNTPFAQTFTAGNTVGTVTFTTASTLPTGLTLSTGGVLSGTPLQTGSFPIVVKATDANGCFGSGATYTLVIGCQTITVTNPSTATGTVNTPFSQTFTAGNTVGTVTFTTASTLPAGLALSTGGVLSGTPTQTGSFPIVVTATDGNGCSGSGPTYTLVIGCQTITVTNPATNTGTINVGFSQQFTASNTIGTVTFSTASALPSGITLSSGGLLSGTPTQPGTFPIVVTATDGNGCTGNGPTYNLVIACQTITVTNPSSNSDPAGTPLVAANFTFTQSGAIGTATFTTASTLPTGVSLTTAGVLTGTPTQGGSFPIVVTVTDSNGCTGSSSGYTLTITCPTITVTNPGVSSGTAGTAFSQTFTQSGGQGTITWSETGTLPTGITLNSATGVLSGTTSQVGTFPITVTATDQNGCTGTGATYNLTVGCQTVTVTNPGVNTGTVDAAFSQTFTVTGILGTVTWSETGALPAGITLNSASGVLSGTPTVPGSFPITVKATDTNGCFGTSSYTLTINCQTITVTKPVTTTGTVDAPFSQTFTQSGVGTHTPATFTLNSGSLPAGLSLSTAGVLSGTPTVTGSFPITVKVTDANGCTGISSTYSLVINCQTITVTNPATTTGTVGVAFSQLFTQSAAHGSATFTTASTLPTGFTLSTAGVLSGTTNQHGTFPIVVTVTDSNGCTGTGATYNLVINCQTITVTNPGVTTGTVGTPFSQTFTQSGAIGGATFTTASTLPTGLSLSTAGLLSGTPLQSGTFPIVVTVTDGNGCTGSGATYTLIIACNVINVTNPGTTSGTAGVAFSATFTQSGGNGTIVWSKSGALPAGISLNSSTGVLSGTTTVTGSFPITVTATDANGCTGTGPTYTLVINCQTITVTNPGTTTGTAGVAFNQTFTAAGILGTVSWSETGALPSGITLNSATGHLAGTTTQIGTFPIVVTATDTNGCTGSGATYNLTFVCQTVTVTNPGVSSATFNSPFSQTFTASGILGTATFTIASGTLPTGMSLSTAGVLSGTPTQTGTFPITVKATDTNTCNGTGATYTLSVAPVATGDSYSNLVDNTQAVVTGGGTSSPGTPFVTLSGAITGNDTPAGGVSANPGTFATSAGGSVTIASDGTFIYTPKANPGAAATTTDTFTYTVSSNTGGVAPVNSAPATVTLHLLNRVWYVNNNGGGSNGQSQSPFTTLAAASAASTANDIIFVYNGNGTNSGQNAGISLLNGQQLLGEINGLIVNAQTLVTAGSRPTIGNAGGAGVTVAANTANGDRTGIFIKGLSIAGTTNAVDISSANAQTLTVTVDNVNITAATANNGVKIAAAGTLTSTVTVQNSTVLAAGQNGIDAQQTTAGNLVLSVNNNTITATGTGINIVGTGSTSTTITNFDSNTVSGNTAGTGISVASATFDTVAGGAFTTVTGGTTNIGTNGNSVGTNGMLLTNVKGDVSFGTLNIYNSAGTGLLVSSTGAVNTGAGTGFRLVVGSGTSTFDSNGGPVVDVSNASINLPSMVFLRSTNSPTTGLSLVSAFGGVGGTTLSASSGQIADPVGASGTAVNINGGNGNVTIGFPIINTSGNAIIVTGRSSDTVSFSGTVSETGSGISLTSNTGATINFTGAITASTGANPAFTATGGGTVTATNVTSTLTTTTGTALNVANTTIGASGLNFLSITAGTAASGPADGIILNTTGASGGLTVIGTGAAASGGTIQKTTTAGISLTSVGGSVSLTDMNVKNGTHDGIRGTSVNNFSLTGCNVTGNGTLAADNGLHITDASGTVGISGTTVTTSFGDNVDFDSTVSSAAVVTTMTVGTSTFSNSSNGAGFLIQLKNTAAINTGSITGCTFNANATYAIDVVTNDNSTTGDGVGAPGTGTITISNNTVTNDGGVGISFAQGGGSGASNMYVRFIGNVLTNTHSHVINVVSGATSNGGTQKVLIDNNCIGMSGALTGTGVGHCGVTPGAADSGSKLGEGIQVTQQGRTVGTVTITNNVIRNLVNGAGEFGNRVVDVQTLGPSPTNGGLLAFDVKIFSNDLNALYAGTFPQAAVYLGVDEQASTPVTMHAEVHGNTVPVGPGCEGNSCSASTGMIFYDWVGTSGETSTGTLYNFSGSGANVSSELANTNTGMAGKTGAVDLAHLTLTGTPVNTVP
jgi:hypothetical protein